MFHHTLKMWLIDWLIDRFIYYLFLYLFLYLFILIDWFIYLYHAMLLCAVPERPNITKVYTWLDEEQQRPQPVIYVEWTVSNILSVAEWYTPAHMQ